MSIKLLKIKRQDSSEDAKQQQQQQRQQQQQVDKIVDKELVTDAELKDSHESPASATAEDDKFEAPLVWRNIILFVLLHSCIPIGLMMIADPEKRPNWRTIVWTFATAYAGGIGTTAGAHRLWSHRSYKVRAPLEILLMLLQTLSGQNSILTWCRDHRVHHKFSETHADPHNIKRGFLFAHMGWLCCRKHPAVSEKGALIDLSDLKANPIVMFQHRNFWWLALVTMVVVPVSVPILFWQERFWASFVFAVMFRYTFSLHATWLVNSAAHTHGSRPYDKNMEARESPLVILFGLGEGFHNYHHTFPFDYSTSEFGRLFNASTAFIDICAALGLAYDLRKMDKEKIELRRVRTGEKRATTLIANGDSSDGARRTSRTSPSDDMGIRKELGELDVARKFVTPFNMDYISGPTSLNYTM